MNENISIKRQERSRRNITGGTKGVKDRKCIQQEIIDIGTWPSGQPMQKIRYLHITRGWKERLLPPLMYKRLNLLVR